MSNDAVKQGREPVFGEAAVQPLVPESLFLVLGASGEPFIVRGSPSCDRLQCYWHSHTYTRKPCSPGKTIVWPPDSDPLCELGRMTEESALYQVGERNSSIFMPYSKNIACYHSILLLTDLEGISVV